MTQSNDRNRNQDTDSDSRLYIGPESSTNPSSLLDEARKRVRIEDEQNKESVKLARRLFIAMILIALLSIVFYIVLPYYGLRLPPLVPILSFLAILTGAVLTGVEESRTRNNTDDHGFR